jgi:hypothetical protein
LPRINPFPQSTTAPNKDELSKKFKEIVSSIKGTKGTEDNGPVIHENTGKSSALEGLPSKR